MVVKVRVLIKKEAKLGDLEKVIKDVFDFSSNFSTILMAIFITLIVFSSYSIVANILTMAFHNTTDPKAALAMMIVTIPCFFYAVPFLFWNKRKALLENLKSQSDNK